MKNITAIYTRVSVGDEGEETSTGIQEEDCRSYADSKRLENVEVYSDIGVSGFKAGLSRPNYERMIADAASGLVKTIIVYKLDRLTRQMRQIVEFIDLITEHDVAFHSVNDSVDTSTPTGKAMLHIMVAMAELESETIRLRVKRGMKAAAEAGREHGGHPRPYGWNRDGTERRKEADHVREVIDRFVAGEGLSAIIGPGEESTTWRNRLMNPRLIGYRRHGANLYPSDVIAPLIDSDTWERLQKRLGGKVQIVTAADGSKVVVKDNFNRTSSSTRAIDPVRPLLRCGTCGSNLRRMKGRYTCRRSGHCYIGIEELTDYVEREAREVIGTMRAWKSGPSVDREGLEAERASLVERLQTLSRARFVDETIGDVEFLASRQPLAERIDEIDDVLTSADYSDLTLVGPRLTLDSWWAEATPATKRAAMAEVIESVTVRSNRDATAELREEAGGQKRWRYKEDKRSLVMRRQVRINWKPFYDGEGEDMTEQERLIAEELEAVEDEAGVTEKILSRIKPGAEPRRRTPPPRKKTTASPEGTS